MRDGQGQGLKTGHNTVTLASAHTSQHSPDWESIPLGKEKLRCHNLQSKGCRGILFSFWFMATKGQSSFFLFYNPTLAPAWKKNIDISFIPSESYRRAWSMAAHGMNPCTESFDLGKNGAKSQHYGPFSFSFLVLWFFVVGFFFPIILIWSPFMCLWTVLFVSLQNWIYL